MYGYVKKFLRFLGILIALSLGMNYLLPLVLPFLLGYGGAAAAEPGVRLLTEKFRFPRPLACVLCLTGWILGVGALAAVAFGLLLRQLGGLARLLPDLEGAVAGGFGSVQSWLMLRLARLPGNLRPLLERSLNTFFSDSTSLLKRLLEAGLVQAGKGLSGLSDSALTLGTAGISMFLISFRFPELSAWLVKTLTRERLEKLRCRLRTAGKALGLWASAQIRLTGVTFALLLSGMLLLRIPHAPVLSMGIALLDALPVLGCGCVLVPWSAVCLIQGNLPRALGLTGIWITAAVSRSVLEPKLVGAGLGLDPLTALAAMYVGFRLWGLGGLISAPLLTACILDFDRK